MGQPELPIESGARVRSRMAFVAACLLLVFAIADAARGGPNLPAVLAARLAWAGALFVAARLLAGRPGRHAELVFAACFVVSIGALTVLNLVAGAHTASRAFLLVAPIVFAVIVPEAPRPLALASVLTVAAAAGCQLVAGGGAVEAAMDALRATTSGVVGVLGALSTRKILDAEIALAGDKARALEALAESERRQAEVEKLAAAGSRAAGVAHDMSNPLASMRCNLEWLRETAEAGRMEADRAEVLEVIRETRECLDRLGQNLQDFRTVARTARALASRVDELAGAGAPIRQVPPGRAAGE